MLELPEALSLSKQVNETIQGKRIAGVTAGHTPHKLAWFYGDREKYAELLTGKTIGPSTAVGGLLEIQAGNARILMGDGVNLRFQEKNSPRPDKHQLLIEFADGSGISAVVQMYGGIGAFPEGQLDNKYYRIAQEKPSPFTETFDKAYFEKMISPPEMQKLSLKAFLATDQRIPGLGNGTLQDILFNAGIHPKRKVSTLSAQDIEVLFKSVKTTLADMARLGGRDTEMDLFGRPGGYRTILCKNTVNKPCRVCGTPIRKEAYLGGAIYYCEKCQQAG